MALGRKSWIPKSREEIMRCKMAEYQRTTSQNIKLFCLKAARPTITAIGIGLVGIILYAGYDSNKEAKIEENFQKTKAFMELDATYHSQCMAVDTPYIRQRMAIEKAYLLQKDSLKQIFVNDLDK